MYARTCVIQKGKRFCPTKRDAKYRPQSADLRLPSSDKQLPVPSALDACAFTLLIFTRR